MIAWQTRPDWPSCLSGVQCDDVTLSPFDNGEHKFRPASERFAHRIYVNSAIVNARRAALMADMAEACLNDMGRNCELFVHRRREQSSEIVWRPVWQRCAPTRRDAGIKIGLAANPIRKPPRAASKYRIARTAV